MFKKKPQIKNLSPLRSSDRRRLADQIISDFELDVPPPTQPPPSSSTAVSTSVQASEPGGDPSDTTAAPTLSSIRSSLLPENCLSARFTTTSGASAALVSGTVYAGAHPGQAERILWIQYSTDKRLYPTVYTLWQNPGLVPLLHTQHVVVEKLKGGADLMVPGLVGGPPWPSKARKGSVVAVASLENPTVPMWVGYCEIDVASLGDVRGQKGKAVNGLHWMGDEVWAWSDVAGQGGGDAPESIPGWRSDLMDGRELGNAVENMNLDDDEEDGHDEGGVALGKEKNGLDNGRADQGSSENEDIAERGHESDHEPTTAEVDTAFQNAFLYSIRNAKKAHAAPHYGFDFPINASYLISNMIQPHLRYQSQHYTIKKTSWKNAKKLIKHLDKQGLVKSKDRNGGETVILDVDFQDPQIASFTPYKLPKPKTTDSSENNTASVSTSTNHDTSIDQSLTLVNLIRPSPRLVPDLLPSKTTFYTPAQISSYLKSYIAANPELTTNTSSPRNLKLNPFLANNVLNSSNPTTKAADTKSLASGEIARDAFLRRILDDHILCPQFWVLLRNQQTWDASDTSLPKPRPSPSPKVSITLEKRTGTKIVTRVAHLEAFGINPVILSPELQRKAAGSASVGPLVGAKGGLLEITVQGDQREVVMKEVERRGVKREWVEIIDKVSKGGKGGGGGGGGGGGSRR